jgi:hypothetical protein
MSTRWWVMGIIIMIISETLDVIRRGWMIEEEATLVKVIAYYRDVAFRSVDQHL